jgi:beta-glucosidase
VAPYRGHFADRAPAPAFWFGHGLGYGTWRYDSVALVAGDPPAVDATVDVTVTNTGTRPSREVVQVYLQPSDPDQPVRLVGWRAVDVAPGATASVTVPTDARLWRRWDTAAGRWAALRPGGRLLVARGLGDVRAAVDLP